MEEIVKELRRNSQKAQHYFAKELAYTLWPVELKNLLDEGGVVLIDVRAPEDFEISHIPGALSVPKDEITNNFDKLSKDKTNVVYCYNQQCHLGAHAALMIAQYDYPVMLLEGGFKTWSEDFGFETV